jgi:hypothetical protein
LQGDDFAPGLRAGGDAIGDRTHPQRVHAVVAARAVGQVGGVLPASEPTAARQMPAHTVRDLVSQVRQLRGGRRAGAMQARLALWLFDVLRHAIEPQHMKVDIKVERAAKALDQRHRAALRAGALDARLISKPTRDHAMHDPQHRADGLGFACEQKAQRVRKTQHPLSYWARAKLLFHQVPRRLGHAPRAATRAKTTFLAGEGHQPFRVAVLAHHAQEAMVEHATAQERPELLAHVLGQRAVFRMKTCDEIRVVRLHQRAQQRALGRMPRIGRCGRQRGRGCAGGARRCAAVQRGEAQHGMLLCSDGCTLFRAASSLPIGVSLAYG